MTEKEWKRLFSLIRILSKSDVAGRPGFRNHVIAQSVRYQSREALGWFVEIFRGELPDDSETDHYP